MYQVVLTLREEAHDALEQRRSLIFYRQGAPEFFAYLRALPQ